MNTSHADVLPEIIVRDPVCADHVHAHVGDRPQCLLQEIRAVNIVAVGDGQRVAGRGRWIGARAVGFGPVFPVARPRSHDVLHDQVGEGVPIFLHAVQAWKAGPHILGPRSP